MMELKPCPFCGGKKMTIDSKRTHGYPKYHCSVSVRCNKCHARGSVVGILMDRGRHNEREIMEAEAIEAWNRRVKNE